MSHSFLCTKTLYIDVGFQHTRKCTRGELAALEVRGLTCSVIRRLCSLIGLLGLEQGEGVLIRVAVYIKTHAVTSCGPRCKPLLRFAGLL